MVEQIYRSLSIAERFGYNSSIASLLPILISALPILLLYNLIFFQSSVKINFSTFTSDISSRVVNVLYTADNDTPNSFEI